MRVDVHVKVSSSYTYVISSTREPHKNINKPTRGMDLLPCSFCNNNEKVES